MTIDFRQYRIEDFARAFRPAIGRVGEIVTRYGKLGRGDGTSTIIASLARRELYYHFSAYQPPAVAPLVLGENILAYNHPSYAGKRIRLGYTSTAPTVEHILGIDDGEGADSLGGLMPAEQYSAALAYPDPSRLAALRLAPNATPDKQVYVNPAAYDEYPTGYRRYFVGELLDLTSTIGDLASTGNHVMALIYMDTRPGLVARLGALVNTAVSGTAKTDFDVSTAQDLLASATFQAMAAYALPSGCAHLYDGQTTISEGDLYRTFDIRALYATTALGNLDSILSDGNGDVLTDGNGDVIYA